MGRIYFAFDTVDQKGYCGASLMSMKEIKYHHEQAARKGIKSRLYDAIRKNGPVAFIWEQLQRSNNPYVLAKFEVEMIRVLGTKWPAGYNVKRGGDSLPMQLPEARKHQSEVVTAAFAKPEVKARYCAAMARPETKANHRAALAKPDVKESSREARRRHWARLTPAERATREAKRQATRKANRLKQSKHRFNPLLNPPGTNRKGNLGIP